MGLRTIISTACWALNAFGCVAFGCAVLYQSQWVLESHWGINGKTWGGDLVCQEHGNFIFQLMAISLLALGLSVFFMGDSKCTFTILLIFSGIFLAVTHRDASLILAQGIQDKRLLQVLSHTTYGGLAVFGANILGLLTTESKNRRGLMRSKSKLVFVVLSCLCIAEGFLSAHLMTDLPGFIGWVTPSAPFTLPIASDATFNHCSNTGKVLMHMFAGVGGAAMLTSIVFIESLKPTYLALLILAGTYAAKFSIGLESFKIMKSNENPSKLVIAWKTHYEHIMCGYGSLLMVAGLVMLIAFLTTPAKSKKH
mmetsp:Transcript_13217/g.21474  ORF Transcript_13217/g.21474 Transcript_13217/m.21474 type:complete len:310 (-) Transcript_13217:150-1079(-)